MTAQFEKEFSRIRELLDAADCLINIPESEAGIEITRRDYLAALIILSQVCDSINSLREKVQSLSDTTVVEIGTESNA